MKKKILVLAILLSLFVLPAAAVETSVIAEVGADVGLTRQFMTENISFKVSFGALGFDGGIRLIENFKKSTSERHQYFFLEPNVRLFLGNFYLGYGYLVNQKGTVGDHFANSVVTTGYFIDIIDLEELGKISVDSNLEFSFFGIYTDADADAGEIFVSLFEYLFNMIKVGVNVTYTFPL